MDNQGSQSACQGSDLYYRATAQKGEPMPIQYPNSDQLPARGEVSILSEKLYNFSLLVVNPVVRKQLKGDPIRTVSDIAVLNDKYALFLEKTELPFQTSRKTAFVTRVYLVALHSGKNFKDSGAFTDDELNKIFMETPKDFMSKTLLFDSSHKDSLDLMPDNPDFDIHETGFEAIALGPNTSNGDRTFMLVSYDNGESESQRPEPVCCTLVYQPGIKGQPLRYKQAIIFG